MWSSCRRRRRSTSRRSTLLSIYSTPQWPYIRAPISSAAERALSSLSALSVTATPVAASSPSSRTQNQPYAAHSVGVRRRTGIEVSWCAHRWTTMSGRALGAGLRWAAPVAPCTHPRAGWRVRTAHSPWSSWSVDVRLLLVRNLDSWIGYRR